MKVVQIIRHFNDGGGERFAVDLSNELYKKGHEVIVLRFHDDIELNFFEPELNKRIRVVTIKKKMGLDLSLLYKIGRFLRKERPDAVHTHLNGFIYSVPSFLFLRKPAYFHTLHNPPLVEAANRVGLYLRKFFFKARLVCPVAISDEVHQEAVRVYGMNDFPLIYNGRSPLPRTPAYPEVERYINSLRADPDTTIVLNIARITEQKNQLLLVNTVKQLTGEGFNLKLLIIGSNQSAQLFQKLKDAADENVSIMERVANVQDYLHASDVFSLSSLWEGMPISLIEAFSTGCIPVCTPAGGAASMIKEGITGFLSESFEAGDFKEAFKRYFRRSKSEISNIAAGGKREFQLLYSIEACAEKYVRLYNRQLNR